MKFNRTSQTLLATIALLSLVVSLLTVSLFSNGNIVADAYYKTTSTTSGGHTQVRPLLRTQGSMVDMVESYKKSTKPASTQNTSKTHVKLTSPQINISDHTVSSSNCDYRVSAGCSVQLNYSLKNDNNRHIRLQIYVYGPGYNREIKNEVVAFGSPNSGSRQSVYFTPQEGSYRITAKAYLVDYPSYSSSDTYSLYVPAKQVSLPTNPSNKPPIYRNPPSQTNDPNCDLRETFGGRNCRNQAESVPQPTSGYSASSIFVNFGPRGYSYDGYLQDSGQAYPYSEGGRTYGWNRDNTSNTVHRGSRYSPDDRFDTLAHFQWRGNENAVWEMDMPDGNGYYKVEIIAGDPNYALTDTYDYNTYHHILAEGQNVVQCKPSVSMHWCRGVQTVYVRDGKLTLQAGNRGVNSKINMILITKA
jgi:hypothetical protein